MDLVLDALVTPDGEWEWKDEAFKRGLALMLDAPGRRQSGRRHIKAGHRSVERSQREGRLVAPDEWGSVDVRDASAG